MMAKNLEKNSRFEYAIDLMENTSQSLFITGKAGTGKSTLLEYFCKHTKKNPVLVAPTGVAALNVGGQTIHRFFNFPIDVTRQKIIEKEVKPKRNTQKTLKQLKTLIIDEISMVRADLLDCIDICLQMYGHDASQIMGGVQIIFVGDLHQLPPIVGRQDEEIFQSHYSTAYFFGAHAFQSLQLTYIELNKVYRQKDREFIHLLNRVRDNTITTADIDQLNTRYDPNFTVTGKEFYVHLTTTNRKADEINLQHLESLPSQERQAKALITGRMNQEYYPTTEELSYKLGAQVMLLSNDHKKQQWVNGSIGVIEDIGENEDGSTYLLIQLQDNKKRVRIKRYTWEVFEFKLEKNKIVSKSVGTFTQYPIRLAWAITIHKSQGKTFDHVMLDVDRGTFAAGQMYVALSRCTTFSGMVLKTPIKRHHIRTDQEVGRFLKAYQASQPIILSQEASGHIELLEKAIETQKKVEIAYVNLDGNEIHCVAQPIRMIKFRYEGAAYQGLKASCETHGKEHLYQIENVKSCELV